ncbi:la protein homolog [Colias croceus]|uniref:la protein homolog n=1 Tax=Colias crocea TaxID=72248 RepID=UPI001E27B6FE|nr:la protein homolog [Colias croceus]XP_045511727.1 la protein homolog [Colias croceus]
MTEEKEISTESNGQENNENGNSETPSDLENNIIRQMEYYFGDVNLPRDKFLKEQVSLDDGWVPLDVMLKFNRLSKLTTDHEVIVNAINKSPSGLLEVSEDNKKVRRNPEMPLPEMNEERRKELTARTVYAKGFPKDSTLDDILQFFKQHELVENVIMRRYLDKQSKKKMFKGSVFATFKTREQATKFVETKGLKYKDTELLLLWQDNYLQQKQEEYAALKEKKQKRGQQKEGNEEKDTFKLPTGTVLFFNEGNETLTREKIKDALTELGAEVAYIDFKSGDTQGWVRLTKENAGKELAGKLTDGKVKIDDSELVFKLLEGDEETAYLEKTVEEMSKRRKNMKNFKNNKGNNRGKNFKGKGRKRKHGNDDGPPAKVAANS